MCLPPELQQLALNFMATFSVIHPHAPRKFFPYVTWGPWAYVRSPDRGVRGAFPPALYRATCENTVIHSNWMQTRRVTSMWFGSSASLRGLSATEQSSSGMSTQLCMQPWCTAVQSTWYVYLAAMWLPIVMAFSLLDNGNALLTGLSHSSLAENQPMLWIFFNLSLPWCHVIQFYGR